MPIYKDPTSPIDGIPSYFFNNTYGVNLVREKLNEYYHQLYFSCLRAQAIACKLGFLSGSMKDFKIDHDLNLTCGFPATTYSTSIQNTFLNYTYERPTLLEPVMRNRMVPITDTFKDSEKFKAGLLFYIGNDLFSKIQIIPCKEVTYLIIFPNDNGLPEDYIKEAVLNNVDWKIYIQKPSNFYMHTGLPSRCFSTAESGIPLSIFTDSDLDGCNKTLNDNAYFAFITDPESPNRNLMQMSLTHKVKGTDGNYYFTLSKSYISSLISGTRMIDLYIVGTRDLNFRGTLGQTRYFQIPIDNGKNPVPLENLRYYALNSNTGVMSPRPDIITTMYYPNVYQIENAGDDNIIVDVYYSNDVSTTFYNPISNYMEYLKKDGGDYALQCINDTLEEPIRNYMPEDIQYSIKDYLQYVDEKGDTVRYDVNVPDQYALERLSDILRDDVNRYSGFFKDLVLDTNHDVFDFDVSMKEHPEIYENTVTQNHAPSSTTGLISFVEPMIWFRFYEKSVSQFPMNVYIDGKILGKMTTYKYGHDVYAYIPKSLVTEKSILHFTIMTQNEDTRFSIVNPIHIDKLYQEITFPANFKHFSDRNLLYYDADTMVRYPNTYFRLKAYFGLESAFLMTKHSEYVLTNADEYIITGNCIATSLSSGLSYKEIGTRISEFYFNMSDSTLMENPVTTNEGIVTDPNQVRTFTEPMVYFQLEAPDTGYLYPLRVKIDDDYTDQIFRYTVHEENGAVNQYVFIPQSLCSADSTITIDLMIAPTEDVLKSELKYEEIPQIRLQAVNEQVVGKNIIIKSIDEYHSVHWSKSEGEANAAYWIIEPTGETDLDVDPDDPSIDVETVIADIPTKSGRSTDDTSYSKQFIWNTFDLEPTKDRIRIWHCNSQTNLGTLVDPTSYMVQSNPKITDSLIITSNFDMNEEDYYIVEYLPWRYSKVYSENRNNPDSPSDVLVDLSTLDRPIDTTYEYFLDGIRLDHNMARFVSPTKFLFVNPNTSLFTIYERSHDSDVYGNINREEKSLEDQLMDIDEDFLEYMKEKALQ